MTIPTLTDKSPQGVQDALAASINGHLLTPDIDVALGNAAAIDCIIYDTGLDDDGGAWRWRSSKASWIGETRPSGVYLGRYADRTAAVAAGGVEDDWYARTGTTEFFILTAGSETQIYRGGAGGFPARVAILAEANQVVIYDITDPGAPMWMVISRGNDYLITDVTRTVSSLAARNATLVIGTDDAGSSRLFWLNFISEVTMSVDASNTYARVDAIASRNAAGTWAPINTDLTLVDGTINGVDIAVLGDAPIDIAMGFPTPTIEAYTDAGTSRINVDDTVADLVDTAADDHVAGAINEAGDSFAANSTSGNLDVYRERNTWADSNTPDFSYDAASVPALLENPAAGATVEAAGAVIAVGGANGLALLMERPEKHAAGMVAHITKDYNSVWMAGDVQRCLLANSKTADRSVKASTLVENGTVTEAAIASGAELNGYSGYSAANYFSQAYSADLDFGAGDFCFAFVLKEAANSAVEAVFLRGYYSGGWSGASIDAYIDANGYLNSRISDDGLATQDLITSDQVVDDGTAKYCMFVRRGSELELWINGRLATARVTISAAAGSLSNANATLRFGYQQAGQFELTNGTLALVTATAYAPTPGQIERMWADIKPILKANADCLLAGDSNAVTALAWDRGAQSLHIGTSWGRSAMRRMRRTTSEATSVGALTCIARHSPMLIQGGASGSDIFVAQNQFVPYAGRPEGGHHGLSEGTDGVIRMEGFSADATPIDIGKIPVFEGDLVGIELAVVAREALDASTERAYYLREALFYRDIGGDVTLQGAVQTIGTDIETTAGMTATLAVDTSAQTIDVLVTGVAATNMKWLAMVHLTRISSGRN